MCFGVLLVCVVCFCVLLVYFVYVSAADCYLEAGQLTAVVNALWLNHRGFAVQMSTVQSFQLTLLISEPSLDFLFGHGFCQVLPLKDE